MAYQNSSPNIYGAPVAAKKPMSHWWVIGVFVASVIFFIIGGGLLGAWGSSSTCSYSYSYYSYYSDECTGNNGEFYGGIAMIAIGAILKFVFWVLLIIWCVQRRRSRSSTVIYVNAQANAEAGANDKTQAQTNVYPAPQANYSGVPQQDYNLPPTQEYSGVQPAPVYGSAQAQAEKQAVTKYCVNCGTPTTTSYCTRCGSQVPM